MPQFSELGLESSEAASRSHSPILERAGPLHRPRPRRGGRDTPGGQAARAAAGAAAAGPEATYLGELHAHIHRSWTDNFLRLIGDKLALNNPLNVSDRAAEVDMVISATASSCRRPSPVRPGFPASTTPSSSLRDAVPYPKPPTEVRSDDGSLRPHWTFARDQRRCSGADGDARLRSRRGGAAEALASRGVATRRSNGWPLARGNGVHAAPQLTLAGARLDQGGAAPTVRDGAMARILGARGDDQRHHLAEAGGPAARSGGRRGRRLGGAQDSRLPAGEERLRQPELGRPPAGGRARWRPPARPPASPA